MDAFGHSLEAQADPLGLLVDNIPVLHQASDQDEVPCDPFGDPGDRVVVDY